MQVFLVIVEDGYNHEAVDVVCSSLSEAVQAANKVVCVRIECFELGSKGLVSIYDSKGKLTLFLEN